MFVIIFSPHSLMLGCIFFLNTKQEINPYYVGIII